MLFTLTTFCGLSAEASEQALLDTLVTNGYLTKEQAAEIATGQEIKPAVVLPKSGNIEKITISGRMQLQYNYFHLSGGLNDQRNDPQGFYFRRLFLGVDAQLGEHWRGTLVGNFGGTDGDAYVDVATIAWTPSKYMAVSAGWNRVPFGYEDTWSSAKIKTIERSILSRTFDYCLKMTSNHTGVWVDGSIGDSGLVYSVFAGNNDNSSYRNDRRFDAAGVKYNGYSGFARMDYLSGKTEYGSFMVGADIGYVQSGAYNALLLAEKNSDLWGAGIHANYTLNRFSLFGEFLAATLENGNRSNSDNATVTGFVVMPSFKVTDTLEFVTAYSYVDADGSHAIIPGEAMRRSNATVIGCDRGQHLYVGGNWYIVGDDVKLQAGYEYGIFEDPVTGTDEKARMNGVRAQMQMIW